MAITSFELSSLDGTNGFVINGIDANDGSGRSISDAGDINGDGFADLIIGAPFAAPGGRTDAGASYVVFGKAGGFAASLELSALDGLNGFVLNGIDAIDRSGRSVSGAGDVNGDGFSDLITGAWLGEAIYIVFGKAGGFDASLELSSLDGISGLVINGIDPYDSAGFSVSGAGDVNGDGFADLIIGAPRAAPGGRIHTGESYVVFGKAGGFGRSLELSALDGTNGFLMNGIDANSRYDQPVSGAGDVNGDGFADLIIGAPSVGESYLVFGKAGGFPASLELSSLDGTNGFVLNGSGSSVSGAGDVNGDGFADLIIGAPHASPGGRSSAGESYVVFGKAGGFAASLDLSALDGLNGFVINGIDGGNIASGDRSGFSVSSAGDVNGDGFADLIIGAPGGDPGTREDAGESYVVFGKASGFAASLDLSTFAGTDGFVINGIDGGSRFSSGDQSGYAVSRGGDVNGDGYDDLIIGAPGGRRSPGETFVIFGSPLFNADPAAGSTSGADRLAGTAGADRLDGRGGDDTITGGGDGDRLNGNGDADLLEGGADDDTLAGGSGDDTHSGDDGRDQFLFQASEATNGRIETDRITDYETGVDRIVLDDDVRVAAIRVVGGDLEIELSGDGDIIRIEGLTDPAAVTIALRPGPGTPMSDVFRGGPGSNTIAGLGGDDRIEGRGGDDSLAGDEGNDTVIALTGDDTIVGGSGSDSLFAGGGGDTVSGGDGDDSVDGSGGGDTIDGDAGNDSLDGGRGANTISGGLGNDTITTRDGVDSLDGGDGDDRISSNQGHDTIDGGTGNDWIFAGGIYRVDRAVIRGGDGNDTIFTSGGGGMIDGGAGNDAIWAALRTQDDSSDSITAGDGNDTVRGGDDNDTIDGGAGDDELYGDFTTDRPHVGGSDWVDGGAGNDTITGGLGHGDTLIGGSGNDDIGARSGSRLEGGDGNDTLSSLVSNATLEGDAGADVFLVAYDDIPGRFFPSGTIVIGDYTPGEDTITLDWGIFLRETSVVGGDTWFTLNTPGARVRVVGIADPAQIDVTLTPPPAPILGTDGDDRFTFNEIRGVAVFGMKGNDTITSSGREWDSLDGGDGNDSITAGSGEDTLVGGDGRDTLTGTGDNDSLDGGRGADQLGGAEGDDTAFGGGGNDVVRGGYGDDLLDGGDRHDSLLGGAGNDTLLGKVGHDTLLGEDGQDRLDGGVGDDSLVGGRDDDVLIGGPGEDTLAGFSGADTMTGGEHGDLFVFGIQPATDGVLEADVIEDYTPGEDAIRLDNGVTVVDAQAIAGDTWLTLSGDGDRIQVLGITEPSDILIV
jgi:Ca2+-binding RTX toxin-like protein